MTYTEYADLEGERWSQLKLMRSSPRHYKYGRDHPRPDTSALSLGRAAHAALYEPHTLTAYPGKVRRGKEWELFKIDNEGANIVSAKEHALAVDMAEAVRNDPVAGPIVSGAFLEQTITWTDRVTGHKCKGRVDQVNGRLGDLKTTSNINPRRFAGDVEKYGYLGQLAFYLDGLQANGILPEERPVIICVESAPPHDVIVYEIGDDDMDAGRDLYRTLLLRVNVCEAHDTWPGIAEGELVKFHRPAWATELPQTESLTLSGVEVM